MAKQSSASKVKKKSISPGLKGIANIQSKLGVGLLGMFKQKECEDSDEGKDNLVDVPSLVKPSKFIVMPLKDEVLRIIMSSVFVAKK